MTTLSSTELRTYVLSLGAEYIPSDNTFFSDYLYKVKLFPTHQNIVFSLTVSDSFSLKDPTTARHELQKFCDRAEKQIQNVEFKNQVESWLQENSILKKVRTRRDIINVYLIAPSDVKNLCEKYKNHVKQVSGPISKNHENLLKSPGNVRLRARLFHNRFRYMLEFNDTEEFFYAVGFQICEMLSEWPRETWKDQRLFSMQDYYLKQSVSQKKMSVLKPRIGYPMHGRFRFTHQCPEKISLFLTDREDYFHLKLLAAEWIKDAVEVKLTSEL